ncbi:MarR family winged helix-turn-helix transcriptional regulator [Candidatus Neomarinimicrobiota bacterium]
MEFGELLILFLLDLQALFRKQAASKGLTLSQVLVIFSIPEKGIDMSGLSNTMGVDNSTTTRLVQVLIRKGWIYKRRDENDRRVTLIRLTQTGENIQNLIEEKINKFGGQVSEAIPLEDRDEIKEALTYFHWKVSKLLAKTL